jgi:hypothetical protein
MNRLWAVAASCAMVTGTMLLAGCSTREHECSSGNHPVWSLQYPETGRACVPDGRRPPHGYATYPAGRTPTYADEENDRPFMIACPPDFPAKPCHIQGEALPLP